MGNMCLSILMSHLNWTYKPELRFHLGVLKNSVKMVSSRFSFLFSEYSCNTRTADRQ